MRAAIKHKKNNKTNINVGAKTELKWNKLECEEHGHNVRNTVTKTFLIFKSKNQSKKQEKRNNLFFSIRDIEDNAMSHPRQRSIPLNGKKEKAESKHTKHWNILQKIIVKKY